MPYRVMIPALGPQQSATVTLPLAGDGPPAVRLSPALAPEGGAPPDREDLLTAVQALTTQLHRLTALHQRALRWQYGLFAGQLVLLVSLVVFMVRFF